MYDERSDRTHTLGELLDRGYEDAYRQFIEPVVGASGDSIATVQPVNWRAPRPCVSGYSPVLRCAGAQQAA